MDQVVGLHKGPNHRHLELTDTHRHEVPAKRDRKIHRLSMWLLDGIEDSKTDLELTVGAATQGPYAQATELPGTAKIRLAEAETGNL